METHPFFFQVTFAETHYLAEWRRLTGLVIAIAIVLVIVSYLGMRRFIRSQATEQEAGGQIPIIALTADALKGTEEELLQSGFDRYLSKPLMLTALKERLEEITAYTA